MDALPELPSSQAVQSAESRRVLRLAAEHKVRRLFAGVYTSNLAATLKSIVSRKWIEIVGYLLPAAVVSHRSAFDGKPENGHLTVTRPGSRRTIELPGLTVDVMPGANPILEGPARDMPFLALYLSSEPRRFLGNFKRGRGWAERVLKAEELEAKLAQLRNLRGDESLKQMRDTPVDRLQSRSTSPLSFRDSIG